jgi:UTP--glucose-1-phosphate uridylyltransferase
MKQSNSPKHLPFFISKMEKEKLPPVVIDTFSYYYKKILAGETGLVFDKDIRPVDPNEIEDFNNIKDFAPAGRNVLKNAVIITLNGGLGTSMGLTTAKSLLEVKNGKTFLEIILNQAEQLGVKLALMNSFSTHEDTISAISKLNPIDFPLLFLQHKFPKILREGFGPAIWPDNTELEWNPPGHGDIYTALYTSEMLQNLIDDKIIFAFISNSDNLGATMDESLLGYFSENKLPFMMEVAERTPADLKGGHLARHRNGRFILREAAQCPNDELNAFRDIGCYGFFNTNNIWINLIYLKDLIEKNKIIRLPMMRNPKTLDPRNEESPAVYQIETAMGAAISLFEDAAAIKVPRSRFFPVKKCNDLLAVRSDCFPLTKENNLTLNPKRKSDTIKINLDPKYYGKIDLFDERFTEGVPSLVDCESLTIEGDVRFEKNILIKGKVKIKNNNISQAVIKEGTILEGTVIL